MRRSISKSRSHSDRDRRPPNENMTALADDLVERHGNSNARTPPCEDGVDPFATTAGAANDNTTADEEDG
ncbi:hypothetical protein VC83_08933 [Pseudogymnoascus destructans]|uniref:Uncharacterized protein n=1 Tax=Pseudogymnoascus destructans TaxID=655981 RepID=A0A176ZXX0_9PEZI|nr:uncharacterized protein VC83_08933 [Pseudogymnoascus destructans]OAF54746.1 hypothetical protein VC83_08933 [Pseudogymnoascus destructans]